MVQIAAIGNKIVNVFAFVEIWFFNLLTGQFGTFTLNSKSDHHLIGM